MTRVQIEGSWSGWDGSTLVELVNGRYFEQAEYFYEYMYAYRPTATFSGDVLHVDGMSRGVRVREVNPIVSNVSGKWTGWDGKTVVKLDNGQIWEQAEYKYEYRYAFRPKALVHDNKMLVEDMDGSVAVRRVR